jgi:cytochrome c-type biogenesis protein CcmE
MNKLAVPLVLIVLGLVGLLVVGVLEGGIPEIQARELADAKYRTGTVKVHGLLQKIESNERPLRFTVCDKEDPSATFQVYADKTRPDTFQVSYDVAVEGTWDAANNRFAAEKILTKCPSKYEDEAKQGIGSKQELERRKGAAPEPGAQAPDAPKADAPKPGTADAEEPSK